LDRAEEVSVDARKIRVAMVALLALILPGCSDDDDGGAPSTSTPNILFIIMDDVGIDQMEIFGYGGETPPRTPNITAIADNGIRFRNTWSMPACTTSRAVFFEARFPLRTNVKGALGPDDLANSMVSPFEETVPKLLAKQGYESALFGKFHLALQGHDPAGYGMVHNLGWDYFAGWLDDTGDPPSIDTTAGGVAPQGTWPCGFVGGAAQDGADTGACYLADGTCQVLTSDGQVPPGRTCRDRGGILDPNATCQTPPPASLDFNTYNGHFVGPLDYNYPDGSVEQVPPTDPRARQFRATFAVDAAIGWINDRPEGQKWMATVSFASDHTPLMQPPVNRDLPGSAESSDLDCSDDIAQRTISNLMIESIDLEVGRLLVETGLARRGPEGRLIYLPGQTDTMIVIVGDNGSLGATVKLPFNASLAKGTAYQTGVWVPLLVAGPLVERSGRDVEHMVNIADLYSLFGEVAGIEDVRARVPRPIDAEPLLPYVTNPRQASIRRWNYTEVGANLQANGAINGPCVISTTCTQIPVTKSVCEDNDGTWYGPGADPSLGLPDGGFAYCCQVLDFMVEHGTPPEDLPSIAPLVSVGIRNDRFKIVENSWSAYVSADEPCVPTTITEFYEINQNAPLPKLDNPEEMLPISDLTDEQQRNYDELSDQLDAIRASVPDCPGDGNIDFVVNQLDLIDWRFYANTGGLSSVYDLNIDGLTNAADEAIIQANLGLDCRG
jgi:hypothetical protein